MNFKNKAESSGTRIVTEEIIEELKEEETALPAPPAAKFAKPNSASAPSKATAGAQLVKRKTPLVLVKPKPAAGEANTTATGTATAAASAIVTPKPAAAPAGLSLLAAYSDSSEDSN